MYTFGAAYGASRYTSRGAMSETIKARSALTLRLIDAQEGQIAKFGWLSSTRLEFRCLMFSLIFVFDMFAPEPGSVGTRHCGVHVWPRLSTRSHGVGSKSRLRR